MAAAARTWGDYVRGELASINTASRATDMKTLREIVDTLRVVVNRCCAVEENAEGLEEPPAADAERLEARGDAARLVAPEQAAEPHEWVRNGNGKEVWYRNTVTDETAWELPPGGILRNEGAAAANERPPPPPAPAAAAGAPAFATAANRAAARGGVPPPSADLATRAGRLAPNMEVCDGVTPEDCRAARVKLRRANSQLAASARNLAAEPVTPPGTPPSSLAASPVAGQSGGKRRGRISRISRKKKNKKSRKSRKMNRRYMER